MPLLLLLLLLLLFFVFGVGIFIVYCCCLCVSRPTIAEVCAVLNDINLTNNKLYDKIYSQSVLKVVAPVRRRSMERLSDASQFQQPQISPRGGVKLLTIDTALVNDTNGTISPRSTATESIAISNAASSNDVTNNSGPSSSSAMSKKYRRSLDKFPETGQSSSSLTVITSANVGDLVTGTAAMMVASTPTSTSAASVSFSLPTPTNSGASGRRGSFTGQAGLSKLLSTK